jgi:hypothetical protein
MRNILAAIAGFLAIAASLAFGVQSNNQDLLKALRSLDARIESVKIQRRLPSANGGELILAYGEGKQIEGFATNPRYYVLLARDRAGVHVLESFLELADGGGGCCGLSLVRATFTEVLLSRNGEKSPHEPNLKFFVDLQSRKAERVDYLPFSVQDVRIVAGAPYFIATNRKDFLVIRGIDGPGLLELVPAQESAKILTGSGVTADVFSTNRGHHHLRRKEREFGSGNRFTIDAGENPTVRETVTAGPPREFVLAQSTFEELARVNPDLRKPGVLKEHVMSMETIGPTQVVGTRLWFGKDFYSGEGFQGVGGFGYFESSSRSFRMFSVSEVQKASVFAIHVEGNIVWLGLCRRWEWGDDGEGLLRVDMRTMRARKYAVPGMATSITRYAGRLYVGTSEGLSVVLPDDSVQSTFIDIARDGTFHLSRLGQSAR